MRITHRPGKSPVTDNKTQQLNRWLEEVGRNQDREAFEKLFVHFAPLLKSYLMKSGSNVIENVEEVVQETMIKVWQRASGYSSDQGAASTWIFTIARNTRIDAIRKSSRQNINDINADDLYAQNYENLEADTPQSVLVRFRDAEQISEKVKSLPEKQAEVLKMMYFEGHTTQQIADLLKLPLGTVKSRIRLALARLKIGLQPMDNTVALTEGN